MFETARGMLGESARRSFEDTRREFADRVTKLFTQAQADEIKRQKFGAQFRAILRVSGLKAYRDGMNSVGYDPESFGQKELAVFRAWQERQSQYVSGLGSEIFKEGGISKGEIALRVRMWTDISLNEIFYRGVAAGDGEQRYRWDLQPEAEHCDDCPMLDGQVHTMTEWLDEGILPGNGQTQCKQGCRCGVSPTTEAVRGNFLRGASRSEHAHDHEVDHAQ